MPKKIAIIGTVGLPAKYGGFETLTEYLTKHVGHRFNFTVYCSSKFYTKKIKKYHNAQLKHIPLNANGTQSIVYDILSIFNALLFADILLILGVSGCVSLPLVKLISTKKIIVNIDGIEWKRAKWGKFAKWFLKYSENLAVKYADVIISDNKVIQQYVQDTYAVKSELIAYGANHATKVKLTASAIANYPFLSEKYAFKVCRIEPENNIHVILSAFSETKKIPIVIVGNWDNSNYGKNLKLHFSKFKNIYLLDPIYDQNILNQIRSNCYIYVHGHSAGGTNPSLVEAMCLGLPIVAYAVHYNIETTKNKALYFENKKELINILQLLKNDELKLTANELNRVAKDNYTWEIISEKYAALFH